MSERCFERLPQRTGIVMDHQGGGSSLRVTHEQVTAVGHEHDEQGFRTEDVGTDAAGVVMASAFAVTVVPMSLLTWPLCLCSMPVTPPVCSSRH